MSTLRVNKLESTSTTDGGISIDTSGHVTIDGQQLPSAGPLSNRNMLINGSMVIDQRNSGTVADTTGANYLSCDRWSYAYGAASKFTAQQVGTTPAGFYKSLQLTSSAATSPSSVSAYLVKQIIEGNNIGHLNFGGANAKTITLSFNVKVSVTGDYSVAITNGANNRSYVTTFNVTSSDWEYKTITIPGDTAGSWVNDNTAGLAVKFDLGSGTNYETATTDAWQSGDFLRTSSSVKFIGTNAATFNITGVQLEVGTVATPFEHRSYGDELAKCQRYFFKPDCENAGKQSMMGMSYNNNTYYIPVQLPVPMRVAPSVVADGGGEWRSRTFNTNAFSVTWGIHGIQTTTNVTIQTSGGSITTGTPFWFETHSTSGCRLEFTAEL